MIKHAIAALALAFVPSVAMAQVSGEVGVYSQYLDDDLFVLTDEPVVQAGVSLDVGEHCSLDVWGSHGIATSVGGEVDLGGSCRFALSEDTEVEVLAARYFLRGDDDMTEVSLSVTHGPVDITVSQYLWDNNADATRVIVGYTIEPIEQFSIRPMVAYETGFGEADILAGGVGAEYALTEQFSIVGLVLTPIHKGVGDQRTTQASIGLRFNF